MSIKHVIHEIGIPGLPGDGLSAPEAAAMRSDLDTMLALPHLNQRMYDVLAHGRARQSGGYSPKTISSTGIVYWDDFNLTFTGLTPGTTYNLTAIVDFRASGSGLARFGYRAVGAIVACTPGAWDWIPVNPSGADSWEHASRTTSMAPNGSGEIVVTPGISWLDGNPGGTSVYIHAWLS